MFSPNVQKELECELIQACNIQTVALSEKYLGLPTMVVKAKNYSFQLLKEGVLKRVKR